MGAAFVIAGVVAVVGALGGLVHISPLWLYGPYRASAVTTAEGALRLFPAWRIHLFGHTVSELLWPGVVVPGITDALLTSGRSWNARDAVRLRG